MRLREVADSDLDIESVEPRGVAARAHEAAHRIALSHQSLRQAPADEPGRTRDQADVLPRSIDGLAAKQRLLAHGSFVRARRRSVVVAISRTTAKFLLEE